MQRRWREELNACCCLCYCVVGSCCGDSLGVLCEHREDLHHGRSKILLHLALDIGVLIVDTRYLLENYCSESIRLRQANADDKMLHGYTDQQMIYSLTFTMYMC